MHSARPIPLLLLLAAAGPLAGCRCGDEPPAAPPPPAADVAAPVRPPRPPPEPPSDELRPAKDPVMSTAVPEGFLPEKRAEARAPGGAQAPWVHLQGKAPAQAVLDFYVKYLDPGVPVVVGSAPPSADGGRPPCAVRAVRARPGCVGAGRTCSEEVCLDPGPGRAWEFREQHPRPPGEPEAMVNVRVMRVGQVVRVTIENETLLRILRENAAADGPPQDPDFSQYDSFEEIPDELIR